jgi:dTDP-glucose pyrophosphorylase
MIEYPIQTLRDMGCDEIIIISGGEHLGSFAEYLGAGYTYRVQSGPGGIAHALKCA